MEKQGFSKRVFKVVLAINVLLFIGGILLVITNRNSDDEENINTDVVQKENINCMLCGKDLTDSYDKRSSPSGRGYFCYDCYNLAMKGIHSKSDSETSSSNGDNSYLGDANQNNSYSTGSDGKVYENNPCGLCGGTGIEVGTARNSVTGEKERRICPACDESGHVSY